ncbi:tyrosine-type recombinase/integrase [Mycobacterium paragordonae]|uniref:tyrosine-type recombinase/integrase n=1 Tax=Mycobacterium paragordonae TaxID=1389713 RepID=UPI003B8A9836
MLHRPEPRQPGRETGCCSAILTASLRDHRHVIFAAGLDLRDAGLAATTNTDTEAALKIRIPERIATPKSDASTDRTIPLAPWLADDLRQYLTTAHPFAGRKRIPHAPLFPSKRTRAGRSAVQVEDFDWAEPIVGDNLYQTYFQPACKALGLGSVRLHDCRHTFATLALSAGENYMQVSKWLGHSSFVLTLTTYADYIREEDAAAPKFDRPTTKAPEKVVPLRWTAD